MSKLLIGLVTCLLALSASANAQSTVEGLVKRGVQRLAQREYDGAIEDFTQAIELSSRFAPNKEVNARGATVDATGFERVRIIDKRTAIAYSNRGVARLAKGDADEAIRDLNQAIAISPMLGEAFNNRGNARSAKGDVKGAIEDYSKALKLSPNTAKLYHNRGDARRRDGDFKGAAQDFERAISLNPKLAEPYNGLGIVRVALGDLDGAVAEFTKALGLDPGFAEVYVNRGRVLLTKGKKAEATADLSRALEIDPALRKEVEKSVTMFKERGPVSVTPQMGQPRL